MENLESFVKQNNLERAREYFSKDRFATVNGMVIDDIGDDYVVCSMEIRDDHRNALGNVMGGAVFTLADFAAAVMSNWGKRPCVSLVSQITYLSAAKGSRLIAEARPVKEGKSTGYYEVMVTDNMGTKVAHVTNNGFVIGKKTEVEK